jgi:bacterioferritin (cytochrome b1)
MRKLIDANREKVLDLLTARLEFERTGVKLYDNVISRIRSSAGGDYERMLDTLEEHRDEEKEHEEWLEQQIRAAGGDAHGATDMSRLEETESQGIAKVILDGDPQLGHALHALLMAELADNAGWDLLVRIAAEAHDAEARRGFRKRLHEEEQHLLFIRRALTRFERREVLGQRIAMPRGLVL